MSEPGRERASAGRQTTAQEQRALLAEAAAAACSAVLNIKGKTYPCDVPKPPGHRTHGNREAGALWEA